MSNLKPVLHIENTSYLFPVANNLILHFQDYLPEIKVQKSVHIRIFFSRVLLFVGEWWIYSLFIILFLAILWFYRRYEIRRIKGLGTSQNQISNSGPLPESLESNDLFHSGREEIIDQCLTGMCDKRVCFFNLDGNQIHIEDNVSRRLEPASIDILLNKINANKFCEQVCREKNHYFPESKFIGKEGIKGNNNLLEFQTFKPYIYSKGLKYSIDSFTSTTNEPFIHLHDAPILPADKEFILNALKIVKANYTDYRFSVEQLARKSNMSVSQINRKLNTLTGLPAGRLVSKFRLHRASELLIQSAESVSDVCFRAGYNGLAYFSRAFKKEFGCTPSVYRQLMTRKSISLRK